MNLIILYCLYLKKENMTFWSKQSSKLSWKLSARAIDFYYFICERMFALWVKKMRLFEARSDINRLICPYMHIRLSSMWHVMYWQFARWATITPLSPCFILTKHFWKEYVVKRAVGNTCLNYICALYLDISTNNTY